VPYLVWFGLSNTTGSGVRLKPESLWSSCFVAEAADVSQDTVCKVRASEV